MMNFMILVQRSNFMSRSVEPVKEEILHEENQISLHEYFKQRRKTFEI